MKNMQEIHAFVANLTLHADNEPITYNDAFIAITEWTKEGIEIPEGLTAQILADTFNGMIANA